MSLEIIDSLSIDLLELRTFEATAVRQRVKDLLMIDIRKLETELGHHKDMFDASQQFAQAPDTSRPPPPSGLPPKKYRIELKEYAWDQSDKFVKIFISIDGVQKIAEESVEVDFCPKSINLLIKDLNNRDYTFVVNNLFDEIDVEKSYRKIKTDMIAIYMKKKTEASKWAYMTQTEKRLKDMKTSKMCEPSEFGDSSDPSAGIMNMMKNMYETGDSEMKRMINKAWAEGQDKRGQDPF